MTNFVHPVTLEPEVTYEADIKLRCVCLYYENVIFKLLQNIGLQKVHKLEMIIDLKTFVHCFSVGIGGTFSIYCGNVLLVLIVCFFAMPETQVNINFIYGIYMYILCFFF